MRTLTCALICAALTVVGAPPASARPHLTGWERTVAEPTTYTVKAGDTLSSIDRRLRSPGPWTRLAYVNRDAFDHPDVIDVGVVLAIPDTDGRRLAWTSTSPPSSQASSSDSSSAGSSAGSSTGDSANAYVDPWGCEAEHAQQWSASGAYWGKYQFDRSTWAAHGGDPDEYGSAPESEQDAVAARVQYDAWPNC